MLKKLRRLWRGSRRSRSRDAQLAELRAAVAGLMQRQRSLDGEAEGSTEIDGVLLHAANARVELERIEGLYDSVATRLVAIERRVEALAKGLATTDKS
jgi:hypothetical protein